jgi:hypothetical protein
VQRWGRGCCRPWPPPGWMRSVPGSGPACTTRWGAAPAPAHRRLAPCPMPPAGPSRSRQLAAATRTRPCWNSRCPAPRWPQTTALGAGGLMSSHRKV